MSRKYSKTSWISGLPLFVGLLATTLSVSARAQSTEFPTYQIGMNQNASTGPSYTAPLSNPSMQRPDPDFEHDRLGEIENISESSVRKQRREQS